MNNKHAVVLFVEENILLLSGAWFLWVVWLFIYALRNGGTSNWVGAITQLIGLIVTTAVVIQARRSRDKGLSPQPPNIQRMKPLELEAYLEQLSPQKRQSFVAHLLAVGTTDEQYISTLTPEEESQYQSLLEKLRNETETEA